MQPIREAGQRGVGQPVLQLAGAAQAAEQRYEDYLKQEDIR
jgi:hypothetical protein